MPTGPPRRHRTGSRVTARDILAILGQTGVLIARLAAAVPALLMGRRRGMRAFARSLARAGVPADARAVLVARYREMVPLNPFQYRRAAALTARAGAASGAAMRRALTQSASRSRRPSSRYAPRPVTKSHAPPH